MAPRILAEFLAEDCDAATRDSLLAEIHKHEGEMIDAIREYTFNRFNLTLDFRRQIVVVEDDLDITDRGFYQLPLVEFVAVLREKALYDKVLDFVRSETRTRRRLSLDTDIQRDIGVTGDDAVEFMEGFQKEFGVDLSDFRFDRYFDEEVSSLVQIAAWILGKGEVKDPITISILLEAAKSRRWPESAAG